MKSPKRQRSGKKRADAARRHGPKYARPMLEILEDRLSPAVHVWVGAAGDHLWSDPTDKNWIGGAPTAAETNVQLYFPSNARDFISNDDISFVHPIKDIFFTGDITGVGYNAANGGPLNDPGLTPNSSSYQIGVAGATTAIFVGTNGITVDTAADPGVAVGPATVNAPVNSTETFVKTSKVLFDPAVATVTFNVVGTTNKVAVDGVLDDAGANDGLLKKGSGILQLNNDNTYLGGTHVVAGILNITSNQALGTPKPGNDTLIDDGATLQVQGNLDIHTKVNLHLGSGTGATLENVSGDSTIEDNVILDAGGTTNSTIAVDNPTDRLVLAGIVSSKVAGDGLTKTGLGRLVLEGANTYDGDTHITAGVVTIESNTALGTPTAGARLTTIEAGATLRLHGNLTTPGGANPENFQSNGGTIQNLSGNSTIQGSLALANNAATTFRSDADSLTFTGLIFDSAGVNPLIKTGAGLVVLTAGNTYTGNTIINAGTLQIRNALALGAIANGTFVNDGGTLQVNLAGGGVIAEPISLQGSSNPGLLEQLDTGADVTIQYTGNLTVLGTRPTVQVDRAGDVARFTDSITDFSLGGDLTKDGPGTMKMDGAAANTYRNTTVLAGTLLLAKPIGLVSIPGGTLTIGNPVPGPTPAEVKLLVHDDQIATTTNVVVNTSGELDLNGFKQTLPGLTLNAGTVDGVGGSLLTLKGDVLATSTHYMVGPVLVPNSAEIDVPVSLGGATRTFTVNNDPLAVPLPGGRDLELKGVVSDGGAKAGIIKLGGGTMELSGNNTYTGLTSVKLGTLIARHNHALGNNSDDATPGDGTTVASGATLQIGDGAGVTIGNEALTLNGVGALGGGLGTTLAPNPGNLQGGPGANAYNGPITLMAASTTIGATGGTTFTLNGKLSGPGGLTVVAGGTVLLNANTSAPAAPAGDNTYAGTTAVQWGTLELNQRLTVTPPGFPTVSALAVPHDLVIGGLGFPATVLLDRSDEIATNVPITINERGTLNVGANSQTIGGASATAVLKMKAGTLSGAGGTVTIVPQAVAASILATSGLGGPANVTPTSSSISVSNLKLNGATLFSVTTGVGVPTEDLIVSSSIQDGTSSARVTLTGGGTMEYENALPNTYSGGTFVNNGTLFLDSAAANGAIPGALTIGDAVATDFAVVALEAPNQIADAATVSVLSNGQFNLNNRSEMIGGLNLTGGNVNLGNVVTFLPIRVLTVNGPITANSSPLQAIITGTSSTALDFNGAIRNITVNGTGGLKVIVPIQNGGLNKKGTGRLILAGGGTYALATEVVEGKLTVDGSQPSSPVTIDAGATLSGVGTTGPVTVNAGGTFSPGDNDGILNVVGDFKFKPGSILAVTINGTTPGTGFDQLIATGNVDLTGATLQVTFGAPFPAATTFTLVKAGGTLTGPFAGVTSSGPNGVGLGDVSYASNAAVLTIPLAGTVLSLVSDATPAGGNNYVSVFGQAVTFTASAVVTVSSPTPPGGTIVFTVDGKTKAGTVSFTPLTATTAQLTGTLTLSGLSVAGSPHAITAAYTGDSFNKASNVAQVNQTVVPNPAGVNLTIDAVSGPVAISRTPNVTFKAHVSAAAGGPAPAGYVTFTDVDSSTGYSQLLGKVKVDQNGLAQVTTSLGAVGKNHQVQVIYTDDPNFNPVTTPVSTAAFTVGTANQFYVNALYVKLLGRQAEKGGLLAWAGVLDTASTVPLAARKASVALGIQSSPEYRTRVIDQAFQHYLGRTVDPTGLGAFGNLLKQGGTFEQVTASILGSLEYFISGKSNSDNATWLDSAYKDTLGRGTSGDTGATAFLNALNKGKMTREQVALAILQSTEYRMVIAGARTAPAFPLPSFPLANDYQGLLNRPPSTAEVDAALDLFAKKGRDQDLIATIAITDEFFSNAQNQQ